VYEGTQIDREHPEWLLRLPGNPNRLFDVGNPAARQWLTDLISDLIIREGVDVYREDFNIDPLPYWEANDAPDRLGLSEIRYVEGFYEFWDELLRRHPGLVIDNCASGGRRIDMETTSRSIPLWRTDFTFEPVGVQSQTWGLCRYIPVTATGVNVVVAYGFRSTMASGVNFVGDLRPADFPAAELRRRFEEQRHLRPYSVGDFYPLTAYSFGADAWMAFQFDRPDGAGELKSQSAEDEAIDTGCPTDSCTAGGRDPRRWL
jgi:alpha-galactosidase